MSRDAASPYANVNAASASGWTAARVVRTVMWHALCVALAIVLFAAYEHLAVHGQSPRSLACLVGAAVFALVPLRAVLGALFSVETRVMHLLHGVWSMFQTIGWNSARSNRLIRNFATFAALVLTVGNIFIPVAVLTGFIK